MFFSVLLSLSQLITVDYDIFVLKNMQWPQCSQKNHSNIGDLSFLDKTL